MMKGTTAVWTTLSIAIGLLAVSSVLRSDSDRESMAAKIKVRITLKYIMSIKIVLNLSQIWSPGTES